MAEKRLPRRKPLSEEAAIFFEEAFGDSVGDATEILDGLQHLIWAMSDEDDSTPPYLVSLWRAQLEVLRARVRCLAWQRDELAKRAAPKAVA